MRETVPTMLTGLTIVVIFVLVALTLPGAHQQARLEADVQDVQLHVDENGENITAVTFTLTNHEEHAIQPVITVVSPHWHIQNHWPIRNTTTTGWLSLNHGPDVIVDPGQTMQLTVVAPGQRAYHPVNETLFIVIRNSSAPDRLVVGPINTTRTV